MSATSPHSRRYQPPLPTLAVVLRAPTDDGDRTDELTGLLDTGADITSVPIRYLSGIRAPLLDEIRLRSHWGHAIYVITYLVDIEVSGIILPAIEVASDTTNTEIVLGRDVINHLLLFIDGPDLGTTILEHRPRGPRRSG